MGRNVSDWQQSRPELHSSALARHPIPRNAPLHGAVWFTVPWKTMQNAPLSPLGPPQPRKLPEKDTCPKQPLSQDQGDRKPQIPQAQGSPLSPLPPLRVPDRATVASKAALVAGRLRRRSRRLLQAQSAEVSHTNALKLVVLCAIRQFCTRS
jgi:hypothetical protein